MDKVIRILAIVSVALVAFSLLLLLITIPFQGLIAQYILGYPAEMVESLPNFPVVPFLSTLARLFFIALLIFCCGNKKGGFWPEILIFAVLVVVLPPLNNIASTAYSAFLSASLRSGYEVAANNIANRITVFCMTPSSLGACLAYCTCGMSIAYKVMNKKLEKVQKEVEPQEETEPQEAVEL